MDLNRIASRIAILMGVSPTTLHALEIVERNDREGPDGPWAHIGYEHEFSYEVAQTSAEELVANGFAEWDEDK